MFAASRSLELGRRSRVAPSFFFLLALAVRLAAQTAPVGTLTGQVTEAASLSPLPGVEVVVEAGGHRLNATTDRAGNYRLELLPAGSYPVTFSYLGYAPLVRNVVIESGRTAALNATFGSEVVELQSYRVEGTAEGQARALNQQRNATNLKNVVAADAIGNFPDKNVAESLQRLPGLSTVSWRGEPLYITIRGANPAWNSVSLDGISLLSANGAHSDALGGDMKSVPLDVFSSSQIGSIEVVKSVTPDLDGDSIGGAVLLKGRSAFDANRRVITLNGAVSYNDFVDKPGYRGSLNYSDVFGAKRDWGLAVSASYEKKRELEQSNETNDWYLLTTTVNGASVSGFVPTTALQTYVDDERIRKSASLALEKKFGEDAKLYVRGFSNRFDETDNRFGVRYLPGLTATGGNLDLTQPITVSSDGTLTRYTSTKSTTRRQEQIQTFNDQAAGLTAGGSWRVDDWNLEGSVAYSHAKEWFVTDQGQWTSKASANKVTFDYSDATFWRLNQLSGTSFLDPSSVGFNSGKHREDTSKSDEWATKLDATHSTVIASTPVRFQTGWKSRWNTKSDDNNVANYSTMKTGTLDLTDSRLGGVTPVDSGFLKGRYDFGPFVDLHAWTSFFNANRAPLNNQTGLFADNSGLFTTNSNSLNATVANDFKIKEDVHAGYLRADWNWGRLGIVAGARYEDTELDLRSTAKDATKASTDPAAYTPYRRKSEYDNWLPGLQFRYPVTDRLVLRSAWTNTLARPNAVAMTPNLSIDSVNLTISGGNPNLHAVKSQNFDVAAEYYLPSVGLISIGAFHKSIDGPIYQSSTAINFDAGNGTERYIYSTYLNAGRARLDGLEFVYQQQFRFLPGPFDGLGFYGNYTLTDSNVDVPQRPGETFTLFNQSKWLGNVALFYQKYGFSGRVAYTFRSGYLTTLLTTGTDTYFDVDHRLDVQLGYALTKHWSVQVTANNLENTPERQYHGVRSRQEFYGLTGRFYSLGFSWEY